MTDILFDTQIPPSETVADCVSRLGTPPEDIVGEWISEAAELTGDDLTSFNADDEIWKSIRVGSDGRLFRNPLNTEPLSLGSSESFSEQEKPSSSTTAWIRSHRLVLAIAVFVMVGLGWLVMQSSGIDEVGSRSIASKSQRSLASASTKSRGFASLPSTTPDKDHVDDLETIDSDLELMIEEADAFAVNVPTDLGIDLSLDAFLPSAQGESSSQLADSSQPDGVPEHLPKDEPAENPTQETSGDEAIGGGLGEATPADLLSNDEEDDADLLDESDEQETSRHNSLEPKVTRVSLPTAPRQSDSPLPEPVALMTFDRVPESIDLQSPEQSKTDFQLQRDDESHWLIVPEKDASPIAKIFVGDEDTELQFQWLDAARELTMASILTAGRLQTSDGDVVYLRPRLDTEPIELTLAKRDLKLKWNLQTPVPPISTEIQISAVVPKDVDWQWIEPLEAASPRSTRGVAMLRLKTSEDTAVVVRIDVKTTNMLSLRLRFGARLDPKMPWQWTDARTIRESFQAVTKQLEIADAELLNLDVVISRAKRLRARRQEYLLEEQRDRIDEAVHGWTIVAKRLAELDQLVAFLDAGASLSPELVVRWDDGEQVILGVREKAKLD